MALKSNPNLLIVEGHDDLQSIAALMGAHIPWPQEKRAAPVWIEISNGAEEILREGFLSAYIKSPEIKTLGVVFDADLNPVSRYSRVCALCRNLFELPETLSEGGIVVENQDQKRFGIWIMPDNSSEGDLETFLKYLVPNASEPLWKHAIESVTTARNLGSACRDAHITKANLYTWLAWQDPPGQSPGRALTKKLLDPRSTAAAGFINWLRRLYRF